MSGYLWIDMLVVGSMAGAGALVTVRALAWMFPRGRTAPSS
jgi:hypothetical protein